MDEKNSYQRPDEGLPSSVAESSSNLNSQSNIFWKTFRTTMTVFLVGSVLTVALSSNFSRLHFNGVKTTSLSEDSDEISFTLRRIGYSRLPILTDDYEVTGYKILDKYAAIIEPSAPMDLYLDEHNEEYRYEFSICEYDESTEDSVEGTCEVGEYLSTSVVKDCQPYDKLTITVKEFGDGNELLRSTTALGLCLYVRREIQTLTSTDLDATMDAMYAVWELSETEGQELYGEDFHASLWFTEAHMFNAAQRDADHIHEGQGFLTQHLKITNLFEKAIQSVDPSVSLPYWDYTTEVDISKSMIFTENTFGSIVTAGGEDVCCFTYANNSIYDGIIPDGRWARIKAEVNTRYSDLTSAYGYLRGAWNTNPSPYVSRYVTNDPALPACSAYYEWIQLSDRTDFLDLAAFGPHASVHGDIGGMFGCDVFDPLVEKGLLTDSKAAHAVCKKWSIILKELYRANFITPKTTCEVTDFSGDMEFDCGFTCDDDDFGSMISSLKNLLSSKYAPSDITEDEWSGWRDFVCSEDAHKVFAGDHLEASSPADPSFWPIHPNLERLFHLRQMAGFVTAEWPTEASDVCDKDTCYEEKYGAKDYYAECCVGHYEDDQLMDFINGNTTAWYGPTNADIIRDSDPTSLAYALPYVYDDVSWSHCDDDFYSIFESRRK